MVKNVTYTIHTKGNGRYPALFNVAGPNEITRGQGATFTFDFGGFKSDKTFSSDFTVGINESFVYGDVTIASGSTLTIDGTLRCDSLTNNGKLDVNGELIVNIGGFDAFDSFREWAGKYTINEMLDGTNKYRTQIPTSEDIESLVIGIEPSTELKDANIIGVWGIIDNITDERNPALSINRYSFEVTVLGEYADYTDHADVESNLKL